jgi:flagellin-like hook-associated protein FlgL
MDTLAEPIERLLSSTEFAQVRDLDIDNSSEEIIDDSGRVIGNVEGMTVSLNSRDFTNKQFEDFVIKSDPIVMGNTLFIATINGQEFICKVRDAELNEGKALTFSSVNGDTLTINIGKNGLNSLKEPENYKFISSAIKKSLMKIGSGIEVRTGFDSDNVTKLVISDISATKLYRNNQNEYVPKLDLLTKESAKVAQEVITNALNLVYSARAKLQGQSEGLDKSVNFLNSTISVTKDASGGYLDTDLVEAASAFAAALKSILAAVSTLQAGAKVADAGLEIIKSAA